MVRNNNRKKEKKNAKLTHNGQTPKINNLLHSGIYLLVFICVFLLIWKSLCFPFLRAIACPMNRLSVVVDHLALFEWRSTNLLCHHPDKTINKRNTNRRRRRKKIEIELYFKYTCKWPILKIQRRNWTGLLAAARLSAGLRCVIRSLFFLFFFSLSSIDVLYCVHAVPMYAPVILHEHDKKRCLEICIHWSAPCASHYIYSISIEWVYRGCLISYIAHQHHTHIFIYICMADGQNDDSSFFSSIESKE